MINIEDIFKSGQFHIRGKYNIIDIAKIEEEIFKKFAYTIYDEKLKFEIVNFLNEIVDPESLFFYTEEEYEDVFGSDKHDTLLDVMLIILCKGFYEKFKPGQYKVKVTINLNKVNNTGMINLESEWAGGRSLYPFFCK